jgi:uncharacterized membrane protein
MTKPRTIIGSALVTAVINVLVASALIAATPDTAQNVNESTPLYQLSPIPSGADWARF